MRNFYIRQDVRSEQNLYEDIVIESLKIHGQDVFYLPRDIVFEDRIFGEEIPSRYNSSYKITSKVLMVRETCLLDLVLR